MCLVLGMARIPGSAGALPSSGHPLVCTAQHLGVRMIGEATHDRRLRVHAVAHSPTPSAIFPSFMTAISRDRRTMNSCMLTGRTRFNAWMVPCPNA
jgi:hypothetical protein